MSIRTKLVESLASSWKLEIINYLQREGYVTYAERLKDIKFVIADIYRGSRISVAAMFPKHGEIVINPAMVEPKNFQGQTKKMMDQLSVLVRHELLHFLLVHSKRLSEHMTKKDPEWEKKYRKYSIHELANMAMDWELSEKGYDEDDKKVVRQMTKYNKVIGGLILSDDHPEWINLTFEEILDKLIDEREKAISQAKKDLENSQQNRQQKNKNSSSSRNTESESQDTNDKEEFDDDEENTDELTDDKESNEDHDNKSNGEIDGEEDSKEDSTDLNNSNSLEEIEQEEDNEDSEEDLDSSTDQEDSEDSEDESHDDISEIESTEETDDDDNSENNTEEDPDTDEDSDEDKSNDELEDRRKYANAWNEIIDRFDNDEISEDELEQLIADIESGKIISL